MYRTEAPDTLGAESIHPESGQSVHRPRVRFALVALLAALLLGTIGCEGQTIRIGPLTLGREAAPERIVLDESREVLLQVVEGPRGSVLVFIPVHISGQGPYAFALDTGASQSLIDREVADELALAGVGRVEEAIGISGQTEVEIREVSEWRIGAIGLPPTEVAVTDLPGPDPILQGLLGSDMLSLFGVVTVDYDRGILVLQPRKSERAGTADGADTTSPPATEAPGDAVVGD